MRPYLEVITPEHDASFTYRHSGGSHYPFDWHLHPEIELTHIISGRGRRFVGDQVHDFHAGEVILLGSNLPHTWHAPPRKGVVYDAAVIQFRRDTWGQSFFHLPEMKTIDRLLDRSAVGLRFTGPIRKRVAQQMVDMHTMPPSQRLLTLWQILLELSRTRTAVKIASRAQTIPLREHDQKRIDKVLHHLSMHYTQPVDQSRIAQLLHLSPSAFSRFFKRMTGRTFMDFLHDLRINHAARLLVESDLPITQICYDSGFQNLSNFNRRFKEARRCSPREFRQRMLSP